MKKIWNIVDILNWGEDYFKTHNIEQPRLNIEHLLSYLLKKKRLELYLDFETILSETNLINLKKLIQRRIKGEPLIYILGETMFYDCIIKVTPSVLIPRSETENMVDIIYQTIQNHSEILNIVDLGTGSGCIAIALASKLNNINIQAVDNSEKSLKIARKNSEINNVSAHISFIQDDMLLFLKNKKFDIIISNPPYISQTEFNNLDKSVKEFEPTSALTDNLDGKKYLKGIITSLPDTLKENGSAFLEFGYNMKDWIIETINALPLKITIFKDIYGKDRFAMINL